MPDGIKISDLPLKSDLPTNGFYPIVINGVTYKIDIALLLLLIGSSGGAFKSFVSPGDAGWDAESIGVNSSYILYLPDNSGSDGQTILKGGSGYENKLVILVNNNTSSTNHWLTDYLVYDASGNPTASTELLNGYTYTFKRTDANWLLVSKTANAAGNGSIPSLADVLATDPNNSYQPIVGGNFLHADDNNIDVLLNAQGQALVAINANNLLRLLKEVEFGDDEGAAFISKYGVVAPTFTDLQQRDIYFDRISVRDGTLINVTGIGYYKWDSAAEGWVQFGGPTPAPLPTPTDFNQALTTVNDGNGNPVPFWVKNPNDFQTFVLPGTNGWDADDVPVSSSYVLYLPDATGYDGQNILLGNSSVLNGKMAVIVNNNTTANYWTASYFVYDARGTAEAATELQNGYTYVFIKDENGWNLVEKTPNSGVVSTLSAFIGKLLETGNTYAVVDDGSLTLGDTENNSGNIYFKIQKNVTTNPKGYTTTKYGLITKYGGDEIADQNFLVGDSGAFAQKTPQETANILNPFLSIPPAVKFGVEDQQTTGARVFTLNDAFVFRNGANSDQMFYMDPVNGSLGFIVRNPNEPDPNVFSAVYCYDAQFLFNCANGIAVVNGSLEYLLKIDYTGKIIRYKNQDVSDKELLFGQIITGSGGTNKYLKFNQGGQDYYSPLFTSLPV